MSPEKMKFLKIDRPIWLFLAVMLYSCSGGQHWKLKIEMPRAISFELEDFKELVITGFFIKNERSDVDIKKEMLEYFAFELGKNMIIPVSRKDIRLAGEDIFNDKEFWKTVSTESEKTVFLTGSAEYKAEIRKALVDEEKRQFEDPFPRNVGLEQRKFFTLFFNLYLIDAGTGEILFKKDFKETRHYINPNQTAYFAFFDLLQIVKTKLFQTFLGEEQIQERYLIAK